VNLPKDYDINLDNRYPILIALDATSHDHDVINAANILNSAELLTDLIIISIINKDRKVDLTPNYMMREENPSEMGQGENFLKFIEKEVIPLIEKKYRTTKYRMISGNSRAGLFAFYTMLEKPGLFDAYFCYSPSFWRNENIIVEKAASFLNQENELNEFLYLSLGSEENDKMKSGFEAMLKVLDMHNSSGIKTFSNYTSNANHGTNAFYSIPYALRIWNEKR